MERTTSAALQKPAAILGQAAINAPEDEEVGFWMQMPVGTLVQTAVALHKDRRLSASKLGAAEAQTTRRAVGYMVLKGNGVEVGAGDRPWPLPPDAACYYGDIRDREGLVSYFKSDEVASDRVLDAQKFTGIADNSFDFVISAHVLEHLDDPIGAVRATKRVLRPGGVAVIALPDMRYTFDRDRPPVTFAHLQQDALDGGVASRLEAYAEHILYVHPFLTGEPRLELSAALLEAEKVSKANMDIHFHAWTGNTFHQHLIEMAEEEFSISAQILTQNENIFVLQKSS